jgi:hypothetical protein
MANQALVHGHPKVETIPGISPYVRIAQLDHWLEYGQHAITSQALNQILLDPQPEKLFLFVPGKP